MPLLAATLFVAGASMKGLGWGMCVVGFAPGGALIVAGTATIAAAGAAAAANK